MKRIITLAFAACLLAMALIRPALADGTWIDTAAASREAARADVVMLDARGAISVTERAAYIGRVRALARAVANAYHASRERLGFPMLARSGAPSA